MKATLIKKTDLKVGHETVLGTVTAIEVSKSGKTMNVTVVKDGHEPFTDRVTTAGNMYVFGD
jgi:hypothetical protein